MKLSKFQEMSIVVVLSGGVLGWLLRKAFISATMKLTGKRTSLGRRLYMLIYLFLLGGIFAIINFISHTHTHIYYDEHGILCSYFNVFLF